MAKPLRKQDLRNPFFEGIEPLSATSQALIPRKLFHNKGFTSPKLALKRPFYWNGNGT